MRWAYNSAPNGNVGQMGLAQHRPQFLDQHNLRDGGGIRRDAGHAITAANNTVSWT